MRRLFRPTVIASGSLHRRTCGGLRDGAAKRLLESFDGIPAVRRRRDYHGVHFVQAKSSARLGVAPDGVEAPGVLVGQGGDGALLVTQLGVRAHAVAA